MKNNKGFTLIEVFVSLVLLSFMGVMLIFLITRQSVYVSEMKTNNKLYHEVVSYAESNNYTNANFEVIDIKIKLGTKEYRQALKYFTYTDSQEKYTLVNIKSR